jgi:hypothetical protein
MLSEDAAYLIGIELNITRVHTSGTMYTLDNSITMKAANETSPNMAAPSFWPNYQSVPTTAALLSNITTQYGTF